MTIKKINYNNLELALKVHKELFPNNSARKNYEDSINNISNGEYYLVYDNEECIGTFGIYTETEDKESAWLGWFGVRKKFRRQHYGSEIIKIFEEMAKERGYKYSRLYTDMRDNDVAIQFYLSNNYKSEIYLNLDDEASIAIEVLIFSKSLLDEPLKIWDNKNIHLTEQLLEEMKYK